MGTLPAPPPSRTLSSAESLLAAHTALLTRIRASHLAHLPLVNVPSSSSRSRSPSPPSSPSSPSEAEQRTDLAPSKRARLARYKHYVPEEETIRNDYSLRYVHGGEWPQNWVLGAEPERRFEEYPKQQRLLHLKRLAVSQHSPPPLYIPYLSPASLVSLLPSKFDAILIDPPFCSSFTWADLLALPIAQLAADPSFVFLWVGSGAGDGLERGRDVLARWGYRRCEDVCWVRTNWDTCAQGPGSDPPTTSLLTRTKQHCLIGIRGTVRRSTDAWFVHCNIDTDVLIWPGDPLDPMRKPPEMYTLIENFCLGMRRLEVFGRPTSLRDGWVTVLSPVFCEGAGAGDGMRQGSLLMRLDDDEQHEDHTHSTNSSIHASPSPSPSIAPPPPLPPTSPTTLNPHPHPQLKFTPPPNARPFSPTGYTTLLRSFVSSSSSGGGNGKFVVRMTSEIDALRPKSPVRGGGGGGSSGVGVGVGVGNMSVGGGGGGGGGGGVSGGVRFGSKGTSMLHGSGSAGNTHTPHNRQGGARNGGGGGGEMIIGPGPLMGMGMGGLPVGMNPIMGAGMGMGMGQSGMNQMNMNMMGGGGGWNDMMNMGGMGGGFGAGAGAGGGMFGAQQHQHQHHAHPSQQNQNQNQHQQQMSGLGIGHHQHQHQHHQHHGLAMPVGMSVSGGGMGMGMGGLMSPAHAMGMGMGNMGNMGMPMGLGLGMMGMGMGGMNMAMPHQQQQQQQQQGMAVSGVDYVGMGMPMSYMPTGNQNQARGRGGGGQQWSG